MKFFKKQLFATLIVPALVTSAPVFASDTTLQTKYNISFLGVNVGKMKNGYVLSDTNYKISGAVRTNSVVSLVAKTKASFASAGGIVGNRLVPVTHNLNYSSGKKKGDIKFSYAKGNVIGVKSSPKVKYKPGSIPVEASHLRNVLDPVSSLLFPVKTTDVGNGQKICNRTVPVFDGKSRVNLVFKYKSKRRANIKGFKGDTFTCAVRYQPVSGIRPFKKNIKFMKANRDIEITLARVGASNVYALFGFKVRTDKGTAQGSAYHFAVR